MATVKIDMGYQMFLLQILIQSVSIRASIKFLKGIFLFKKIKNIGSWLVNWNVQDCFWNVWKGGEGAYIWNVYKYNVHTVQSSMKKTNDRPSESISISCGNGLYQEKFLLCSLIRTPNILYPNIWNQYL